MISLLDAPPLKVDLVNLPPELRRPLADTLAPEEGATRARAPALAVPRPRHPGERARRRDALLPLNIRPQRLKRLGASPAHGPLHRLEKLERVRTGKAELWRSIPASTSAGGVAAGSVALLALHRGDAHCSVWV